MVEQVMDDGQMDNEWKDRLIEDGWMDDGGWLDGQMDEGWKDGWMVDDGWMMMCRWMGGQRGELEGDLELHRQLGKMTKEEVRGRSRQ